VLSLARLAPPQGVPGGATWPRRHDSTWAAGSQPMPATTSNRGDDLPGIQGLSGDFGDPLPTVNLEMDPSHWLPDRIVAAGSAA